MDFETLQQIRAPSILLLNTSEAKEKHYLIDVLPVILESLHLIIDSLPGEETLMSELLELVRSKAYSILR